MVKTPLRLPLMRLASTRSAARAGLNAATGRLHACRMVNGIADSQQRGRVAVSVNSLAEAAGLSRLLVDVRHEATHNELPSLSTLQLAARHALDWLVNQYWCVAGRPVGCCVPGLHACAPVSAAAVGWLHMTSTTSLPDA